MTRSSTAYAYHLAVFLPSSSPTASSGGTFVFYGLQIDTARSSFSEIVVAGERECAPGTGGSELRGFDVVGSDLWAAWDLRGEPVLHRASVRSILGQGDAEEEDGEEEGAWETLESPEFPAFTPTYFEELIDTSASASSAVTFIDHLFYPSRFSPLSLQAALEAYILSLLSSLPPMQLHPPALSASYPSQSQRIAGIVGCQLEVEVSSQTGERLHADYDKRLRTEWLGFLARCEEEERRARFPVGMVPGPAGSVVVVQRDGLVLPVRMTSVELLSAVVADQAGLSIEAFAALPPASLFNRSFSELAPLSVRQSVVPLAAFGRALSSALGPADVVVLEAGLDILGASPLTSGLQETIVNCYEAQIEPFIDEGTLESARSGLGRITDDFEPAAEAILRWLASSATPSPSSFQASGPLSSVGSAMLAAGFRTSVELRYRLALDLVLAVFFVLGETEAFANDAAPASSTLR